MNRKFLFQNKFGMICRKHANLSQINCEFPERLVELWVWSTHWFTTVKTVTVWWDECDRSGQQFYFLPSRNQYNKYERMLRILVTKVACVNTIIIESQPKCVGSKHNNFTQHQMRCACRSSTKTLLQHAHQLCYPINNTCIQKSLLCGE